LTLTIAIWALATSLRGAETKSDDLHRPQKLADGVWAMMTKGGSNAGWFLFGDGVIAVDAGSDESASDVLSAIAETTGGKKISYLILTNNFGPHAGGSAGFARRGAKVVAAEKFGPYLVGYLTRGANPSPSISATEVMTLSQRVVLSDAKRLVEIDFVGPADSGGDLVVYLPNEQVLYSGDLVEAGILPPLFSKELEPEGWIATLEKLGKLNVKKLVPGYGPIGPVESIEATHSYLQQAFVIAKRAIADKVPQDFLKTRIQEPDLTIKALPAALRISHLKNVEALVQRLKIRSQEKLSGGVEKK
jgi:glyoxylase-like metal-dependent hydrolase (beta-lactamase superfamily II)